MNNLDKKILELFQYLINSGTKYLREINYSDCKLIYTVGDKRVSIKICTFCKDVEQKPNSYTTVGSMGRSNWYCGPIFSVLSSVDEGKIGYKLNVEGKIYIVPKLQRAEHAYVLDRLEAILEEKESEILNSVLDELTVDSREEL